MQEIFNIFTHFNTSLYNAFEKSKVTLTIQGIFTVAQVYY
nr:MAG TPA: hypothetical protein [Caudoviricetes sp.]